MLEGALTFARSFQGRLVTETMLVAGVNDGEEHLSQVAGFLERLQPDSAYLAVPTRPPAEEWARAPDEGTLNRAYQDPDRWFVLRQDMRARGPRVAHVRIRSC
jgi:wyosine [tRNA(Phe)-imidazoG37] synthetase (radical SAM superfamily)